MSRTPHSEWVVDALDRYERPLIRYAKWLLGDLETARDVDPAVAPRPEHDASARVLVQAAAFAETGTLQALGVVDVCREEDIEGCAVVNLREEVAR